MTTYHPVAPHGVRPTPPPKRQRSRRYVAWAVFLFFVPPTLVALTAVGMTVRDARDEVRIEVAHAKPVELEPGAYFYATPAADPGTVPCRLVDLDERPPSRTRLEDERRYPVTHQEREFVNRGGFDITHAGRYRLVCPDAARLVVLRHVQLGPWVLFLLPAAGLAGIGQLVAVVMFFRMRRPR